ncbi:hypothetical protein PAXRUDRAFT_179301 [Paxillus rubicundulus Ve08.2h10]|uniref:Unplaced genomic scaffold scaffold_5299, whole genome shotgun sequence n=1 Tax=Paxillus rubicundulus Ve08.2h10 TaxID=930991 RepID=A0A0D0D7T9_9AGAM|nr:hypothetical protein PAXRUDRAFT_179301 [Paxillus rubicundulus Ve08.2h10]
MKSLVNNIIAPYFDTEKDTLGLPPSQKAIWQIEVWSVHRSQQFRTWMKEFHPTIVLQFVPGGCTGILQPCDVGIQRVFKHLLKCSYHADIVTMMTTQIEHGVENLVFNKCHGFL